MKLYIGITITLLALVFGGLRFATAARAQEPPGRPRQAKPVPKPAAEADEKGVPAANLEQTDEALRREISALSSQISLLAVEIGRLRKEGERGSAILELLLNEDRLGKLEDKIQEATNSKAQLDAREQEIQRRMRNIQAEVTLRGGLRRDEAEAAIRSELQRALEDVHAQQASSQQRLAELVEQTTRLRDRTEKLRKRIYPPEPEDKLEREK